MAPMSEMPDQIQKAPARVLQAYQFAVANPDLLKALPCYCGCKAQGHTDNYVCYVQEVDSTGKPTFDMHALGCTICVDITQDAMRLSAHNQTAKQIRSYIDAHYAKYGASNMTN